jgi:undecaprenyl diphosphate synthase
MSDANNSPKETDHIPSHVGIILDGNRRWAKAAGKKTLEGHKRGAEVFKEISQYLFSRGVHTVSAYIFSNENWNRAAEEVDYLMNLVVRVVETQLSEFHKKGIRIRIIGRKDNLSKKVLAAINRTEEKTKENTSGELVLCFNYGGRQEIVDAAKALAESRVSADEINEEVLASKLYAPDISDVDMIVRTSGEKRLSGFMLWRASYSELFFIDKLWPDIETDDFAKVLEEYAIRERRFGC